LTLRSTWSEALAQLGELNAAHHLGHDDWRMPNVNELMTLAPGSSNDLGLNLQADCAWSSTRVTDAVADDHETAWILEPTVGSQLLYPVANASCVLLPVRGGP
jgi:hypothetical protein